MPETLKTISPVDGSTYVEREYATPPRIEAAVASAAKAQHAWRRLSVAQRAEHVSRFVDVMVSWKERIAESLVWQMGRPIADAPKEVGGFAERARYMISVAAAALADKDTGSDAQIRRFIRREPLGVVLVVAPWNYPYLTSVNAVVPALMAGNTVVLKHSAQTPLVAEHYSSAWQAAGGPEGVLQHLHLTHAQVSSVIADERIGYVAFTGSVAAGGAIQRAASARFIHCGLELGGKDPAYVRADADLTHAVSNLVDGAYFNAGQSCCGIKRVYVHRDLYQSFLDGWVDLTYQYRLGSPLEPETTLGPVVRTAAADKLRRQIREALASGARSLIDEQRFAQSRPDTPYLAPQALVDVNHQMPLMREESFGPLVGIMPVASDEEAVSLMNDSRYGLTAAVYTNDETAGLAVAEQLACGTTFMNSCDYLDPALAWTGVKDSGVGCTLSTIGYESLTRPKSFRLRRLNG